MCRIFNKTTYKMEQTISETKILIGEKYQPALIEALDQATSSIRVLMFDWRWYPFEPHSSVQRLNMAFARAVQRGVKCEALVNNLDVVAKLKEIGVDAKRFNSRDLLHSKLALIDDCLVFIGSHNFTKNAFEHNNELSLMIYDTEVGGNLSVYFKRLWQL